jgi:hypothetical protein
MTYNSLNKYVLKLCARTNVISDKDYYMKNRERSPIVIIINQ